MEVRDMTIEEVQKVIERKNEEIRKLTKLVVNLEYANDYVHGVLLAERGIY